MTKETHSDDYDLSAAEDAGSLQPYAEKSFETAIYPGAGTNSNEELSYLGLGIAGESGELVDIIKKIVRMGPPDKLSAEDHAALAGLNAKLIDELGDVFWYLAQLMRVYNFDLQSVLRQNMVKLQDRYGNNQIKHR